jgi:hypothetical protein
MKEKDEVYFNKIFILQSLINERHTGEEIEIKIKNISYKKKNIDVLLIDVLDKHHFFKVLDDIKNQVAKGILPFIHFEIHGSILALVLANEEQITWEELKHPLLEINKMTHNNLFVSLATCYGAYLLKIYKPWEPCPFYGYIGPMAEVKNIEVEASYSIFFEVLLLEDDFSKAIEALQNTIPTNSINYAFLNCYGYFDKLISLYKEGSLDPRVRAARAKQIVKKFKKRNPDSGLSNNEIKKQAERQILTHKEDEEFERMRKVFLHEL